MTTISLQIRLSHRAVCSGRRKSDDLAPDPLATLAGLSAKYSGYDYLWMIGIVLATLGFQPEQVPADCIRKR